MTLLLNRILNISTVFLSITISLTLAGYASQLRSEFYNELKCPTVPAPLFEGKVSYLWLFLPSRWYMPMASEKIYRQSAEVLLGRPARSQAELDLIDLRLRGSLTKLRITGFGQRSFRKACFPINRPLKTWPRNLLEATCFALWGSRDTDLSPAARGTDSINWTDNENAVLITPCDGHHFNWLVLSKRPTISEEVKETVLNRVAALGFDPSKAAYYDYENTRFVQHKIPVAVGLAVPVVEKSAVLVPSGQVKVQAHSLQPVSFPPQNPFFLPQQTHSPAYHGYGEEQIIIPATPNFYGSSFVQYI